MSYVLIIEDNQDTADLVIRLLHTLNLDVKHTLRGLDGAKMARKDHPALILIDFKLPDIDGRSLILVLKKQLGGDSAPPIVALTAYRSEFDRQLAQRFGCAAYISKPFQSDAFLNVIKSLIPDLIKSESLDKPLDS